jgi:hypothetical protein
MDEDMTTVVAAERERLTKERSDIGTKISELQSQLGEIDRKLVAIEAYEKALSGKVPARAMAKRRYGGRRARHGEKQAQMLRLVEAATEGATRGELVEKLGVKGNKAGEQSASNALHALKKAGKINSTDGRWHIPPAKKEGGRRSTVKRRKASK